MANTVGHASLTSLGTISYNGIDLTGPETEVVINQTVVPDSAGRTEEYVRINIEIRKIITAANIETVINKLSAFGGELKLQNYGWSNLWINGNSGTSKKDIAYGPKPTVLSWRPIQPGLAWELHWAVETCIPYCSDGSVAYSNKIQSLCYSISYDINDLGLTTRTITGHLTIPATRIRQQVRAIPDNADLYWEKIKPTIPLAFSRIQNNRTLSEDKRTLTFTLVDQELVSDEPYPKGIVHIDMEEGCQSNHRSLAQWRYSISGTIQVARPYPKSWAWDKFALLLASRRDWQIVKADAINFPQPEAAINGDPPPAPVIQAGIIRLLAFNFSDQIFGRQTEFSATWIMSCEIKNIIKMSGVFAPIGVNSWDDWRGSMVAYPMSHRGSAGFVFDNSNDAILDLCVNPAVNPEQNTIRTTQPYSTPSGYSPPPPSNIDNSWVAYECKLTYEQDNGVVEHKPLPTDSAYPVVTGNPSNNLGIVSTPKPTLNVEMKNPGGAAATDLTVTQQRGSSRYIVSVSGYAERINHPITEPTLISVGGKPAVRLGGTFSQMNIGNVGMPRYLAKWSSQYLVEGQPGTIPVMPVPANQ